MKKNLLWPLLSIALTSSAQVDPFAELELDAASSAPAPDPGMISQLFNNASGSINLSYSHFLQDPKNPMAGLPLSPQQDSRNDFWTATVDFESFTRKNNGSLGLSGWIQSGNHDSTFEGTSVTGGNFWQDDDVQKQRYLCLNELYVLLEKDSFDITLGKKKLKNGTSVLFSPADNLMPILGVDPINTQRGGIWQGRVDYHHKNTTYTVAIIPVYEPSKMPPPSSRWYATAASAAAGYVPTDVPEPDWNNIGYFGRAKTIKNGWDLYASCYAGPGRQYLFKYDQASTNPQGTLQRTNPDVITPSMGYSTLFGSWEIHGETTYTHSMHHADQDYLTFTQGFTKNFDSGWVQHLGFEQIFTTVEYSWEWVTDEQDSGGTPAAPSGYVADSSVSRFGKKDLLSLTNFKFNEKLNIDYGLAMRFDTWGYLNHISCNWKCMENATLSVGVQAFGGSQNNELSPDGMTLAYGNWTQNNRTFISLKYLF